MNITKGLIRFGLILAIGFGLFTLPKTSAADADLPVPLILMNGFKSWAAKGASYAFDIWKKGGLLENDSKPQNLTGYFSRMDGTVGKYVSYETIQSKRISPSSQTVYLAINFEHAAVYARFLMYRTDKDWVVQNMDFSPKPEAIMPWLAFAGDDYSQ